MAPIRTVEDCAELAAALARYYQRRLNRLLGVGHKSRHRNVDRPWEILICKAKRDCSSEIARRIRRNSTPRPRRKPDRRRE